MAIHIHTPALDDDDAAAAAAIDGDGNVEAAGGGGDDADDADDAADVANAATAADVNVDADDVDSSAAAADVAADVAGDGYSDGVDNRDSGGGDSVQHAVVSAAPIAATAVPASPPTAPKSTERPTVARSLSFRINVPPPPPLPAAAAGSAAAPPAESIDAAAHGAVEKRERKLSTEIRQLHAVEALLAELPPSHPERQAVERTRSDLAATAAVVAAPKAAPAFPFPVSPSDPTPALAPSQEQQGQCTAPKPVPVPSPAPASKPVAAAVIKRVRGVAFTARALPQMSTCSVDGRQGAAHEFSSVELSPGTRADAIVAGDAAASASTLAKFESFVSLFDSASVQVQSGLPVNSQLPAAARLQPHPGKAVSAMQVENALNLVATFDTAFALAAQVEQLHLRYLDQETDALCALPSSLVVQRRPKKLGGSAKNRRVSAEDLENHRFSYAVDFMNKESWSTVLYSQKSDML